MLKSKVWFKKVRWSYLPVSWQGWVTYIPYATYLVLVFMAVDRRSRSVSDTVFDIFPQWVAATVVMHWFASHTS